MPRGKGQEAELYASAEVANNPPRPMVGRLALGGPARETEHGEHSGNGPWAVSFEL